MFKTFNATCELINQNDPTVHAVAVLYPRRGEIARWTFGTYSEARQFFEGLPGRMRLNRPRAIQK